MQFNYNSPHKTEHGSVLVRAKVKECCQFVHMLFFFFQELEYLSEMSKLPRAFPSSKMHIVYLKFNSLVTVTGSNETIKLTVT